MSQRLISLSPDLKRLRDEGYDIEIKSNFLLIKSVPYVNSKREINKGILVSELNMAGEMTAKPSTHVAYFVGSCPCNKDGSEIKQKNQSGDQTIGQDLVVNHTFSCKPTSGGYQDYYEKITTYVAIILSPAQSIDPNVTAKTFPVIETLEDESVFKYLDTASSRAGINIVTDKLALGKVGIAGLGGTGAYILDLIAKTPIGEIHLFDGDDFLNHNAFRSPGAPSVNELNNKPKKVAYFAEQYSRIRRNIIPHDCYLDSSNIGLLQDMNFVFLCLDRAEDKLPIVERLEEWSIPFIDVGMGVHLVDDSLLGVLRITSSTAKKRNHVHEKKEFHFQMEVEIMIMPVIFRLQTLMR